MPATPVPRPAWLKVTAPLAIVGVVGRAVAAVRPFAVWPVLAMLGLLGAVPAQAVLDVGIVTAALAYLSIRRIKADRAAADASRREPPESRLR